MHIQHSTLTHKYMHARYRSNTHTQTHTSACSHTYLQFLVVLLVKIVCLPFLQLGAAMACDLPVPAAMSLIMLSVCPVSSMSFVVSSQYNHGADVSATCPHSTLARMPCGKIFVVALQAASEAGICSRVT